LSITLAIMNLLPIPVLDGGHLVFLIYEGITRREPSVKVRMVLQQVGFILIIGLMIFVTFNDIVRFAGF
jgi:regulator of sigma E protease